MTHDFVYARANGFWKTHGPVDSDKRRFEGTPCDIFDRVHPFQLQRANARRPYREQNVPAARAFHFHNLFGRFDFNCRL